MRNLVLNITKESRTIAQAVKGNRIAQKAIYDAHAPLMLSVCRQYIGNRENAEECMLNGFFKAFKNLKKYKGKGSFQGWIRRIMVNECLDHLRKKNPFQFINPDQNEHLFTFKDEEPCSLNFSMDLDEIQKKIDELPVGYRTVFVMHTLDDYKHKEIAEILHISENTSRTQLHKAKKMLKTKLNALKEQRHGIR